MNELDYAVFGVVLLSLLIGVWRGAVREIINVLGWVAAFFAAQSAAPELKDYLSEWMADPSVRMIVAWLLVFFVVMITINLVGSLIADGMRKLGLGALDRGLGAIIGLLRGALILVLLTLAAGLTTFPKAPIWNGALFTPWLESLALHSRPLLPESLARRITYDRALPSQTVIFAPTFTPIKG